MKKRINFDKEPLGIYTNEQIKKAWGNAEIITTSVKPKIVNDGDKNVLEIGFSKGKFGKEDKASWHMDLMKNYEVFYCQYKLKFEKGFDWRLGGKLPGFAGGNRPGGGKHSFEGFSSRVMWRRKGEMHQYSYYPNDSANYGTGFWWHNLCSKKMERLKFRPGKWHTIKMKIKMNHNWEDPGYIICWLDGKLALHQEVKWMQKGAKYGIRYFMFTLFFGGNDKNFAPKKDCKIYFDDFIMSNKDIV